MKIKKNIIYIGNNLTSHTAYHSTMDTLSILLQKENYSVKKFSNKVNKVARILDMCFAIIKHRKTTDFVLIDTFSTSNFYYSFCVSQISRIFKIKYIPILHGGNLPYRINKSKKMSDFIFKNAYKNIAPSFYLKEAFERSGYKTEFIPNILEVDKYEFFLRENVQPRILWVRAFKKLYNPTMAIEVLKLIKEKHSDAKLCMIGPVGDESFDQCKKLVSFYNMESSVEFTGVLSKKDWHKKSEAYDVFINTTNFDNTPVSVMEAMALGLTVISTNAGGMPFLIENNIDGILVDKENSNQMADVILNLIENKNNDLALMARKKAESFGWDVVRQKWISVLE